MKSVFSLFIQFAAEMVVQSKQVIPFAKLCVEMCRIKCFCSGLRYRENRL